MGPEPERYSGVSMSMFAGVGCWLARGNESLRLAPIIIISQVDLPWPEFPLCYNFYRFRDIGTTL